MNHFYLYSAASVASFVAIRALLYRRRMASDPQAIISELRNLPTPTIMDDCEIWSDGRDAQFWKELQGIAGMWRMRRKAMRLRDLVASLDLSPEDQDEMRFIVQRCYWITILTSVQLVLLPLSLPHFVARWSTGLYSEIRTRSLTLCCEYNRDLYASLRVIS